MSQVDLLLDEDEFQQVKQILAVLPEEIVVWAYGSRVKGGAHSGSDLDLALLSAKQTPLSEWVRRLKEAFEDSSLTFCIDVVDYHQLPPAMQQEIDKHKIHLSP